MRVQVFLLLTALAGASAALAPVDKPIHLTISGQNKETIRDRRWLGDWLLPKHFTCHFLPNIAFYPDNAGPIPAYKCTKGVQEVLLATRSFHSATDSFEYANTAKVNLDDNVLKTVYPGSFRQTQNVLFNFVRTEPVGNPVAVNGLLVLESSARTSRLLDFIQPATYSCEFLPNVNFLAADYIQLPAYKCARGGSEVLVASDSFRSAYNPYEYVHFVEINLDDSVLKTYYPGSFVQVMDNQFRSQRGLKYDGTSVAIRGVLPLTTYY